MGSQSDGSALCGCMIVCVQLQAEENLGSAGDADMPDANDSSDMEAEAATNNGRAAPTPGL